MYFFFVKAQVESDTNKDIYYYKFIEKSYSPEGELLLKEHLIVYSAITIQKVSSLKDIPKGDIERHKESKSVSSVYIFNGVVDLSVGKISSNEKLNSNISINNNAISQISLFLKNYKQSQAPPNRKVYIVGEIDRYTGPSQYGKSRLYTRIHDTTVIEEDLKLRNLSKIKVYKQPPKVIRIR